MAVVLLQVGMGVVVLLQVGMGVVVLLQVGMARDASSGTAYPA